VTGHGGRVTGLRRKLRCFFGWHEWRWHRNVYGDEINLVGGMRSVYRCENCFGFEYRDELGGDGNDRSS